MNTTTILTEVTATIGPDQALTIIDKPDTRYNIPSYHCIGGNMGFKTKVKGFKDLYKILRNLSRAATWFWWGLIEERDAENNISVFRAKDNLEAKKITKAYKELREFDLIKRVTHQKYLINPKAYLPYFKEFDRVQKLWESTK